MALTETWLTVDDAAARREVIPSGIKLMDQPRIGCSGGICFVYKKISASKRLKAKKKSPLSLLSLLLRVRHLLQDWWLSTDHLFTTREFVNKFTAYLESIILSVESLLIVGDFNLHVNNLHDPIATDFLDTLESMNLQQHVHGPTHELDHTLDLVITRQSDTVLLQQPTVGRFFSDHAVVICSLNSARPCLRTKFHSYRKLQLMLMR